MNTSILDALTNVIPNDAAWQANCPVCGEHSLIANLEGNILECANQCDAQSILAALDERLKGGQAQNDYQGPRLLLVGEFLTEVGAPPPMLIDEIMPDNSLILLAAKPKHLKSFQALDILDAVCLGRKVFGQFTVNRPGPVVYFGMEDGKYEIANRLLKRGMKPGDPRRFYVCDQRLTLSKPENMAILKRLLGAVRPVLIVIDTAREALGINDWFNPAEVADKVRPLRDLAREVCTVLLIAHNRKMEGSGGDEISGSNAFTSSVDGWLSTYRKETLGNNNVRLFLRKEGRGGLRGETVIEMDTHTLHFTALSAEEIADAKRQAQAQEQDTSRQDRARAILRLMAATNGKATAPWIASQLEINERTAQDFLKSMTEASGAWIADSGERTGATGRTIVYCLTDSGKSECEQCDFPIGEMVDLSPSHSDGEEA